MDTASIRYTRISVGNLNSNNGHKSNADNPAIICSKTVNAPAFFNVFVATLKNCVKWLLKLNIAPHTVANY